ncbi:unnamed protein product [Lymnaea stagnalis]|uniref:Uncharacterized protein n=1 Tax=Lymnaea stagnalis TaxID=6523 RepID=A0AAV2HDA3_LYMST
MTSNTNFNLFTLFALLVFKTSCIVVITADSEEDCSKEADKCACEYHQAILPAVNGIGGLQVCEVFNLMISCIELEPSSLSQEARYDRAGHLQKELEDLGFKCSMCKLQACHQTYLKDVAEPLKQGERLQTCRVYGRLQWCVDQLDCDLGGGAKQEILETVYSELNRKGLRCVQEDESSKYDAMGERK